jgi:hypothetical protein
MQTADEVFNPIAARPSREDEVRIFQQPVMGSSGCQTDWTFLAPNKPWNVVAGASGTASVSVCQGYSSEEKHFAITAHPAIINRNPNAPRVRARRDIANRNALAIFNHGNNSDHATARIVPLSCSIMAIIPKKTGFDALQGR